jgi:hypothetical protein
MFLSPFYLPCWKTGGLSVLDQPFFGLKSIEGLEGLQQALQSVAPGLVCCAFLRASDPLLKGPK